MSDSHSAESAGFALVLLVAIMWGVAAWMQPTERLVDALEREYGRSPSIVRRLVGPIELPSPKVEPPPSRAAAQIMAVETSNANRHIEACVQLTKLRAITCLAVYLVGLPLLVAAWQFGKARQRACFRDGFAPSPQWQKAGWVVASLGLILPTLGPAPFVASAAMSFGWLGAAGSGISATGAYLLGRHSRSG